MATPESFYREAIDLNRYSNQVARRIITNYNNVILDLTNKLATIDEVTAPATVARIRSMLVQMKESLETWSTSSSALMIDELQSLAVFQSGFIADELQKVYREEDFSTPTSRFVSMKLNCTGAPREKNSNDSKNKDSKLTKYLFVNE